MKVVAFNGSPRKGGNTEQCLKIVEKELNAQGIELEIIQVGNQVKGCCDVDGKYEYTIYTSCISADKGIYYYKTYDGHRICAVDMHKENLDSAELIRFPMIDTFNAEFLN